MATCTKCKTPLEQDTRFCDECGTEQPQTAFCDQCGAVLEGGEGFCSECGAAREAEDSGFVPTAPAQKQTAANNEQGKRTSREILDDFEKKATERELRLAKALKDNNERLRKTNRELLDEFKKNTTKRKSLLAEEESISDVLKEVKDSFKEVKDAYKDSFKEISSIFGFGKKKK